VFARKPPSLGLWRVLVAGRLPCSPTGTSEVFGRVLRFLPDVSVRLAYSVWAKGREPEAPLGEETTANANARYAGRFRCREAENQAPLSTGLLA
jgi:hypothetical protein